MAYETHIHRESDFIHLIDWRKNVAHELGSQNVGRRLSWKATICKKDVAIILKWGHMELGRHYYVNCNKLA